MRIWIATIWLGVLLLLLAASNYLINMDVYSNALNIKSVVSASLSGTILLYLLAGWQPVKSVKWISIIQVLIVFLLLFVVLAEVLIFQFSGEAFGKQTFMHFELQALWIGFAIQPFKYCGVVFSLLALSVLLVKYTRYKMSRNKGWIAVLSLIIFLSFHYGIAPGRLVNNYVQYVNYMDTEHKSASQISHLESFGVRPVNTDVDGINAVVEGVPKNLIIIYLESFSLEFSESNQYPELTPNINQLKQRYGNFKNYQSTANFTMQGIISSLCGLVPKMVARNNIIESQIPYLKLPCLTDVLNHLGYHQEFVGGARKSFSNKEGFLKAKKYDRVFGWLDYAKDKSYTTNDWGLQDSDLFDFAWQRIIELRQKNQPFHISMLTLSTHLNGNPDPVCPKYDEAGNHHKFIQGIHCADYLLGKFIQQLSDNNVLSDTAVLITSDHGVFNVPLIKDYFGKDFNRNQLLGILIDDFQFDLGKPIALYDVAPLLLAALDVKTNVSFINGLVPNEVDQNRFILRENILNGDRVFSGDCPEYEYITLPINPCENEWLLESSWRYAHNFTQQRRGLNLNKNIQVQTDELGRVSLKINDEEQTNGMMIEGYPLSEAARKRYSHLHVLELDMKQQQFISKHSFRIDDRYIYPFINLLKGEARREQMLFIFAEQGKFIDSIDLWKRELIDLGFKEFHFPDQPFFSIVYKKDGWVKQKTFTFEQEKGMILEVKGVDSINWDEASYLTSE
ncbi:MAG: LTA synthase family protein [Marinicella sp.]